jgi:hypothetical protein
MPERRVYVDDSYDDAAAADDDDDDAFKLLNILESF